MNPYTNKFEQLSYADSPIRKQEEELAKRFQKAHADLEAQTESVLVRPNGEPVPKHWTVLAADEHVVIKGYVFKVAHIGEAHLLLEPVGVWQPELESKADE